MKVYRCLNCENVVVAYNDEKKPKCCDEEMMELITNSTEGENDIHVPVIRRIGSLVTIKIGEKAHPMVDVHHLMFVILETNKGIYYKELAIENEPVVDFLIFNDEEIIRAYAYCNDHELWSTDVVTYE